MSRIRVNATAIMAGNAQMKTIEKRSSGVRQALARFRGLIDGRIFGRRGIGARHDAILNEMEMLERQFGKVHAFVNSAMRQYTDADARIMGSVSSLASLGLLGIGASSAVSNVARTGARQNANILRGVGRSARQGMAQGSRNLVDAKMNAITGARRAGRSKLNFTRRIWDEGVSVTRENLGHLGTGARRVGQSLKWFGSAFVEETRVGWNNLVDLDNKYLDDVLSVMGNIPVIGKPFKAYYYFRTGARLVRGDEIDVVELWSPSYLRHFERDRD